MKITFITAITLLGLTVSGCATYDKQTRRDVVYAEDVANVSTQGVGCMNDSLGMRQNADIVFENEFQNSTGTDQDVRDGKFQKKFYHDMSWAAGQNCGRVIMRMQNIPLTEEEKG